MTPEIIHGDALTVMAKMDAESIDCIVTDPPYSTISGGNGRDPNHKRPTGILAKNDGKIFAHNSIKPEQYAAEFYRILKPVAHCWIMCNEKNRRKMEDDFLAAGFQTHFLGAWIKNNCTVNRWGMKNGELIFLFRKGKARDLYTPGLKQYVHHKNPTQKRHPTEKPVGLMQGMVMASSRIGELVLDPFCGSGSTLVACALSGRRSIGIESYFKYAKEAKDRLDRLAPPPLQAGQRTP